MADRCLILYITDRTAFGPDEPTRRRRLLEKIAEAARAGVDYIQLREKDLPARELASLACEAVRIIRENASVREDAATIVTKQLPTDPRPLATALLINSRTDIALAVGADGVHLRSNDISPEEVKKIWEKTHVGTAAPGCPAERSSAAEFPTVREAQTAANPPSQNPALIAVSCHSPAEVANAAVRGATFAVFGPVFEKKDAPDTHPAGLAQLREACKVNIPVLALGGVTLSNTRACHEAGAAGIAAIRLFQENNVEEVVRCLRSSDAILPTDH